LPSTYDVELVGNILGQIEEATDPEQVCWILTHNLDTLADAVKDLSELNRERANSSASPSGHP